MKINNISITSHTALDFEINVAKPIIILRGKHSEEFYEINHDNIMDAFEK